MVLPTKGLASSAKVSIPSGDDGPGQHGSMSPELVRHGDATEAALLASLKTMVAGGDQRLDAVLGAIADAAVRLTSASGSALAMWKEGAMVCRARSGKIAPALGARLNADTGISGECLRTGKSQHCYDSENNALVDVEVCRVLGLRSIAVLPIQGWRGVNGILEVFSTSAGAFTEHHLTLLEQLAALAERARASQPHGASAVPVKLPAEIPESSGLLPASDRVGDVALAFVGRRSRPLVVLAMAVVAILLLGFAIWLGWRGPDDGDGKAHAAAPTPVATVRTVDAHLPDNDPVWKANPGGEILVSSGGKSSAGIPVKLASKVEVISSGKTHSDNSLLAHDAATIALPRRGPELDSNPQSDLATPSPTEETISIDAPSIPADQSNSHALEGVLSAKVILPGLSAPVSQGVSGGRILRRVPPVYPEQAKIQRLEGKVLLNAIVAEDGSVRDLKVVQGNPTLAKAALDAVKQWRYQPFVLDGKPTKTETAITIDFKLPSATR